MNIRKFKLKKQAGFTLIELGFVLVVVGLLAFPVYQRYANQHDQALMKDEADNILGIAGAVADRWANQPDFTGTTEGTLIAQSLVPESMVSGTNIINKAKGKITCLAVDVTGTGVNDGLECTSTNYPKAMCNYVVQKIEKTMRRIIVGSTTVKATDTAQNMQATGCAAGANTVKFVMPK